MMGNNMHHDVVISGAGAAGTDVGARLLRTGITDVAIIEPSDTHWYHSRWTPVGGGYVPLEKT